MTSWKERRREAARTEILDHAWAAAREHGLAALTLRDVAARVGMRAPSLYTHFDSKHAIYDAMYGQAWAEAAEVFAAVEVPPEPRARLRSIARTFFEYAAVDLARHQLMNIRAIPDFTPSRESYAVAVAVYRSLEERLAEIGITEGADVDLFTAIIGGLVDAQWANDPGGTRWARLIDRATDMYADNLGLLEEEK